MLAAGARRKKHSARTRKALYPSVAGTRQAAVWREFAASAPASGAKLSLFGRTAHFLYH